MKSSIPRVVPWTSYQEFKMVFECLYADVIKTPDAVQHGVDMVKAWISRGRAPVAVKSTMDFIELQLRERKQLEQGPNDLSQNELRLLYGCALVRFVNTMADSHQTGYYAKSLYTIAEDIGLPRHFVQLRHAVTHEELPSLFMLRQASVQALQWLYDFFWIPQKDMDTKEEINDRRTHEISEAITNYKEKKKAALKNNPDAQLGGQKYSRKLIDLSSPDTLQETVIVLLLKVGALVPSGKSKRSLNETMPVPEELLQIWVPLLQDLDSAFPNFATELITMMVNRLGDANNIVVTESSVLKETYPVIDIDTQESEKYRQPSYLWTIASWLRYFTTHCDSKDRVFEEDVVESILNACLRTPNRYTQCVLEATVSNDPTISDTIGPFLKYFNDSISIYESTISTSNTTSTSKYMMEFTDTVLEQEVSEMVEEARNLKRKLGMTEYDEPVDDGSAESGWVLHDKDTWAPCPIGCLPNGEIPVLDFFDRKRLRTATD